MKANEIVYGRYPASHIRYIISDYFNVSYLGAKMLAKNVS